MRISRVAPSLVACAACAACSPRSAAVGDGYAPVVQTFDGPISKLDVVFVVDDSLSMADDQRALVEAARDNFFAQLDAQEGGRPDLHLAIVSSSITVAAGGIECDDPRSPDGRFVLGDWHAAAPPCSQISGAFLADAPDGQGGRVTNYTGSIGDAFACAAMLGESGCGLEQPLEAMRRSIDGSHPENAGFLRDDAMLLVVFLTDEEDASAFDFSVFAPDDADEWLPDSRKYEYGMRCDPDDDSIGPRTDCAPRDDSPYFTPVGTYADALRALKADPAMVMVAGITPPADPVTVVGVGTVPTPQQRDLAPACTPPDGPCADDPTATCPRNPVQPAIRLGAFLELFPARYTFASICDQTMAQRVHQIAGAVGGVMHNDACVLGDTAPAADRCRAFDVDAAGVRAPISVDFAIDPVACGYTPSQLRAITPAVPAGHHALVECLRS